MKQLFLILSMVCFTTLAQASCPAIDAVGEPVGPTGQGYFQVCHTMYSSLVSSDTKNPVWDAGVVTADSANGKSKRGPFFKYDPQLPVGFGSTDQDYQGAKDKNGNMIARGHNYDANDSKLNDKVMHESFYFTNMFPQLQENNAGVWKSMETIVHNLAIQYGTVYVVNGPIYASDQGIIGNNVKIPSHLYKVIYIPQLNKTLGYIIPNTLLPNTKPKQFTVSQDYVEQITGLKFFPKINGYIKVSTLQEIGVN